MTRPFRQKIFFIVETQKKTVEIKALFLGLSMELLIRRTRYE